MSDQGPKNINHEVLREKASEMITNLVIAQIQLFAELCSDYGIDRTSLSNATREYCERVRVGGLKVKKPKTTGWLTMDLSRPQQGQAQRQPQQRSSQALTQTTTTFFKDISTITADDADVRMYRNMRLNDNSYPAISDPLSDVATFAISYDSETGFSYRDLDDADGAILSTYGIPYKIEKEQEDHETSL